MRPKRRKEKEDVSVAAFVGNHINSLVVDPDTEYELGLFSAGHSVAICTGPLMTCKSVAMAR